MFSVTNPQPCEILNDIHSKGMKNGSLRMTKSFKGMLLKQNIQVLEISPNSAVFQATDLNQCASLQGSIYLQSPSFPRPVKAQLMEINPCKGMLILSNFTYTDSEWKERIDERVQPHSPVYLSLRSHKKSVRACLENISQSGIGVLAYRETLKFEPGSKIYIDFPMSSGLPWQSLKGMVIYVRLLDQLIAKAGIRLIVTSRQRYALEQYISLRQKEILSELNCACIEARETHVHVEELYF